VGKAVSRIATETTEQIGTKLSSSVERIGQKATALKESIGETVGKLADDWIEHNNRAVERAIRNGRKGELGAVGEIHPQSSNPILAEVDFLEYPGSKIDVMVEGAKPSVMVQRETEISGFE
jgi:hypothetical protein